MCWLQDNSRRTTQVGSDSNAFSGTAVPRRGVTAGATHCRRLQLTLPSMNGARVHLGPGLGITGRKDRTMHVSDEHRLVEAE
jgi:hypothetical protein